MKIQITIDGRTELTVDDKIQNLPTSNTRPTYDEMYAYDAGTYAGYFKLLKMGLADLDTLATISVYPKEELEEMVQIWRNASPLEQTLEIERRLHIWEKKLQDAMKQKQQQK